MGKQFEVHTTERGTFKTCKQKWEFTSPNMLDLEPNTPQAPLEFGTGFHRALAAYYDPKTPRYAEIALFAWEEFCTEQRKFYERTVGKLISDNDEALAEFDERRALGAGMLEYFAVHWSPTQDEPLETVWVERPYTVRLRPRSPYVYSFKPDALFIDHSRDGKYVLGEWKTAANISDKENWLDMDEQSGSYILGLLRSEEIFVDHVAHTTFAKQVPHPLKQNKDGNLSRDMRQLTTYDIALPQLTQHYSGHIPPEFNDLLIKLSNEGSTRFIRRAVVRRNINEIERLAETIQIETKEMVNLKRHPELITRNPSQWNCSGCAFIAPCLAKYEGSDQEDILLSHMYRKRVS